MAVLSFNDFVAVPIPVALYAELLTRYPDRVNTIIEDVTRDFLERTAEDHPKRKRNAGLGLTWDIVFLPSGTRLRTKYHREYKYADIKGDSIVYNGQKLPSLSQLARQMRGDTSVNAWIVMEIMRPNDPAWTKADLLRRG